jgi:hypothetical protein
MQLRFASFAVINLREDFHLKECARAGRTKKKLGLIELSDSEAGAASRVSDKYRSFTMPQLVVLRCHKS